MGPPDPILGVTVAYQKSTHPKKVNLGVGAYRDDNGKPFILNCVRKAEERIFQAKMNHEYAGISGVPEFIKASQELLFGPDHPLLKNGQVHYECCSLGVRRRMILSEIVNYRLLLLKLFPALVLFVSALSS